MFFSKKRLKVEPKKKYCSAVIVAAGSSERMGIDKMRIELGGTPVLVRTIRAIQDSESIGEIVVVTREDTVAEIAQLCNDYGLIKVTKILVGGKNRTESALAGVCEVKPEAQVIAIHDGARPLVTPDIVDKAVSLACKHLAAAPAVPVKDTVKEVEKGVMSGSIDRNKLVAVQTPQVFEADLIKAALTDAVEKGISLTDDCAAVELLGVKTRLSTGSEENMKITTPHDLAVAESILLARSEMF